MEFLEFEGKTTEEAIEQACSHFKLPPESLDIEIISVGSPGLFGLGGRKARVRVKVREEGEADLLAQAQELLERILELMGEKARISGRFDEEERISLSIDAEDAGLLIGKQGQTLEALQYLLTKMIAKKARHKVRVFIDIESYRARHQEALTQLALKSGEKAKKTGKPITLNPMNPHDRRIIHLALQGDKEVKTMSRGEGLYKKVVVYPMKKKEIQEDSADSP
jgi:spoIIIJ-associated protein|uniref:RNA-binding protein KhpB n=1 Tax=Desulfobacca acetoxidans TaxID=60893 RepID=A0A7C3UZE2_9BACT